MLRTRSITRDRGRSLMIKGSIHEEDLNILNRTSKYIKQKFMRLKE